MNTFLQVFLNDDEIWCYYPDEAKVKIIVKTDDLLCSNDITEIIAHVKSIITKELIDSEDRIYLVNYEYNNSDVGTVVNTVEMTGADKTLTSLTFFDRFNGLN